MSEEKESKLEPLDTTESETGDDKRAISSLVSKQGVIDHLNQLWGIHNLSVTLINAILILEKWTFLANYTIYIHDFHNLRLFECSFSIDYLNIRICVCVVYDPDNSDFLSMRLSVSSMRKNWLRRWLFHSTDWVFGLLSYIIQILFSYLYMLLVHGFGNNFIGNGIINIIINYEINKLFHLRNGPYMIRRNKKEELQK